MANLMFDGAEGLGITFKGWITNTVLNQSGAVARTGSKGYTHTNGTTTNPGATYLLPSTVGHGFFGVGHRTSVSPSHANCNYTVWDNSTAQVGWRLNSDGSISVYRGTTNAAALIGTTAAGVFIFGSTNVDYQMIELEIIFDTGTAGSVILRVSGVEVLNVSGIQTSNSANNYADRFSINGSGSYNVANCGYDDFYVNDNTGSAPENTFFGEALACVTLLPASDGTYDGQWTPSTGTNASALVTTSNADTDYISGLTTNDKQSYNMEDVSLSGTIIGINKQMIARKDDVARREIADLLLINGTDYLGTTHTLNGSYQGFYERILINPDTGARFTVSDVNALQLGVKVITGQ